jgi:hypothetical protein
MLWYIYIYIAIYSMITTVAFDEFSLKYFFVITIVHINKSTAHGCWTLDFFVSDIKLQAIYKVIHTSNLSADWGQHFLQVYWVSS